MEKALNNQKNYCPKTLAEANQVISLLKKDNQNQFNQIKLQQEKIDVIEQQYENLQQQLATLLRNKYGKSSEKLPDGIEQLSLFDGPKSSQSLEESLEEPVRVEHISYTRKKRNGHRNIPDDLLRVRIEHTLEDLSCPCGCGNVLHKIGEVIAEQLEIVPGEDLCKTAC